MVALENFNIMVVLAVSFAVSVTANWLGVTFADRMGMFALPSARRRHGRPVPVSGGLWIVLSALVGVAYLALSESQWFVENASSLWRFGACVLALLILGWFDDRKILNVRSKFLVQLGVGLLAMTIPEVRQFTDAFKPLCGVLVYPLTLVFIVGITNAVNFIDGADGLLGTMLVVSLIANGLRGAALGHTQNFAFALLPCWLGGVLGFLLFNWRPARIFMGDTGSLTLGFTLVISCICLGPASGKPHWEGSFSEALSGCMQLGYPILDLLWVIMRRLRRGFSPFRADQNHLHHCLLRLGFSVPMCVLALCWLNLCLQVASFQVLERELPAAWPEVLFATSLSLTYLGWIITVDRWKTRELSRMANPEPERGAEPVLTFNDVHDFALVVQTKPLFEGHHFGGHDQAMAAIQSLGFLLESNCPKGSQVLWQSHTKTLHLAFPNMTVGAGDVKGLHARIQTLIDNWIEMFNVALSAPSLRVSIATASHLREPNRSRRLHAINRNAITTSSGSGGEDTAA